MGGLIGCESTRESLCSKLGRVSVALDEIVRHIREGKKKEYRMKKKKTRVCPRSSPRLQVFITKTLYLASTPTIPIKGNSLTPGPRLTRDNLLPLTARLSL